MIEDIFKCLTKEFIVCFRIKLGELKAIQSNCLYDIMDSYNPLFDKLTKNKCFMVFNSLSR